MRGPLAGRRWIVGAGTHGCWLGTYERDAVELFATLVRGARTVYDVGAHAGYYTMIASTIVGAGGTVVAFEPVRRNVEFLTSHLRLNGLRNVRLEAVAVADVDGELPFDPGDGSFVGRLSPAGRVRVPVVSLDRLTRDGDLPDPDVMKVDVEGAEVRVLEGAAAVVARARPALLLSVHSEPACEQCTRWLEARGYRVERVEAALLLAQHAARPARHA
jgi:FkbM family methyltransferase